MRCLLALLLLTIASPAALADPVNSRLFLRDTGLTTNAFIYEGAFDVYEVQLYNQNTSAATSVEMTLLGDFIQAGGKAFLAGSALPVLFGFDAPDSFFVLPEGQNPLDVLATGTIDDSTGLAAAFTLPGAVELVPPGLSTIAIISVPAGTVPDTAGFSARAAIEGQFVDIGAPGGGFFPIFHHGCTPDTPGWPDCPEPSTALLIAFGLAGICYRR